LDTKAVLVLMILLLLPGLLLLLCCCCCCYLLYYFTAVAYDAPVSVVRAAVDASFCYLMPYASLAVDKVNNLKQIIAKF